MPLLVLLPVSVLVAVNLSRRSCLSLYPCACACACVCARCVFFHLCFWRWLLLPCLALVIRSQDEVGWSGPACFAFGWVVGCVCG